MILNKGSTSTFFGPACSAQSFFCFFLSPRILTSSASKKLDKFADRKQTSEIKEKKKNTCPYFLTFVSGVWLGPGDGR